MLESDLDELWVLGIRCTCAVSGGIDSPISYASMVALAKSDSVVVGAILEELVQPTGSLHSSS